MAVMYQCSTRDVYISSLSHRESIEGFSLLMVVEDINMIRTAALQVYVV